MELHVAILGGHPPTQIPMSRQYHQLLAARLRLERGISAKVFIGRQEGGLDHAPRLRRHLAEHPVDAVVLQVNPIPYLRRCKPLIRVTHADCLGGGDTALHPKLVPLFPGTWESEWDDPGLNSPSTASDSPLRELHALCGMALGLGLWARRMESQSLWELRGLCVEQRKPLFVIGPWTGPLGRAETTLCAKLSRHLRRDLEGSEAAFIDYPDLEADETRHERIGDALFRGFAAIGDQVPGFLNSLVPEGLPWERKTLASTPTSPSALLSQSPS